ncbi:ABC transporter substrate-binding protein [Halomonas sp. TRM85114]|nr:ABC transporter substrate-binding protein [Halomonas jincaotanensis]MBS9402149.1 ABC transporter substrate-binding protein [Halomonas jincaotanensis]
MLSTTLHAEPETPAVVTLDWTQAETLVALGIDPLGVAQIDAYHDWVGEPRMPESTVDLGLRNQPNLELLASLSPDHILISPMFANLTPRLSRIAPVENLALYTPPGDTWGQIRELTRETGALVDRTDAAERLIETTESRLENLKGRLPDASAPLLLVQFMDARHVRVFGANGLYQAVLDRLGLTNAWTGTTNDWGFSLVGIERLAGIEARLVVVEPYPVGVPAELQEGGLWQHQASVRDATLITLPPVWSFGALPSARRFAEQLVAALDEATYVDD